MQVVFIVFFFSVLIIGLIWPDPMVNLSNRNRVLGPKYTVSELRMWYAFGLVFAVIITVERLLFGGFGCRP